jgi:peptidoglycan/xylan/chitin deacetylase (PgdA/CDA1 family)
MSAVVVTTSWDDGHKHDLRLAGLLKEHGLKGTFYISPRNQEFSRDDLLTPRDVSDLGDDFEIGAHTVTHPRLPTISLEQAKAEIVDSKAMLEDMTGKEVGTFCYPGGAYTAGHVQLVKEAGFRYARTVARHQFQIEKPYEAPTSLHTYKHWSDVWDIASFAEFRPAKFLNFLDWDTLGKAMFDRVLESGGIYHIWGHSWEIDERGEWERLESVFRYISAAQGVRYAANGELV